MKRGLKKTSLPTLLHNRSAVADDNVIANASRWPRRGLLLGWGGSHGTWDASRWCGDDILKDRATQMADRGPNPDLWMVTAGPRQPLKGVLYSKSLRFWAYF